MSYKIQLLYLSVFSCFAQTGAKFTAYHFFGQAHWRLTDGFFCSGIQFYVLLSP